jgi:hypothetical protein
MAEMCETTETAVLDACDLELTSSAGMLFMTSWTDRALMLGKGGLERGADGKSSSLEGCDCRPISRSL